MRQRDRTRVDVWLKCLESSDHHAAGDPYGNSLLTVNQMMHELGETFGRLIILWQEMGTVRVQVLPLRDSNGTLAAPVAASYRGNKLATVLERAILDATMLNSGACDWEGTAREVIQWVA